MNDFALKQEVAAVSTRKRFSLPIHLQNHDRRPIAALHGNFSRCGWGRGRPTEGGEREDQSRAALAGRLQRMCITTSLVSLP